MESFKGCYWMKEEPIEVATTVEFSALHDLLKLGLSSSVGLGDFVNVHAIFIIKRAVQLAAALPLGVFRICLSS